MKTNTIIETRVFNLTDISEKEGSILRTLLNLNKKGIEVALIGDKAYWDGDMSIEDAVSIGEELRDKIAEMVDY